MDWKQKVDNKKGLERLELERLEKIRVSEEQKAREAVKLEKINAENELLKQKIAQLGSTFRCHICGKPAKKPYIVVTTTHENADGMHLDSTHSEENWEQPGDLTRCSECRNWTCEEHVYKGICQTCAEKM